MPHAKFRSHPLKTVLCIRNSETYRQTDTHIGFYIYTCVSKMCPPLGHSVSDMNIKEVLGGGLSL